MRHLGKTPPFRGSHGEVLSGSIAEAAYRRLGGLDQWALIRGEGVANPALMWTSLLLLAVAAVGAWLTLRRRPTGRRPWGPAG